MSSHRLHVFFREHIRGLPLFAFQPESRSTPNDASHEVRNPSSRQKPMASTREHGFPTSRTAFRPRRFSRPRRFTPPPALWVYFAPQPRTGFSLQGVSLPTEPYWITPAAALMPLSTAALQLPAPDDHASTSRPYSLRESVDQHRWFRPALVPRPSWDFPSPGIHPTCRRNAFTSLPPRALTVTNPLRPTFGVLPAHR